MAARAFLSGRELDNTETLPYIYEHLMLKHTGMNLTEIRNMRYDEFQIHLRLCMISEGLDREFQAGLAGASTKKKAGASKPLMRSK